MILGIDTSCYTTSVALMDQESRLICDMRRLLAVEKAARGLRQSDAVYAHTQNLPQLLDNLLQQYPAEQITAIAVSNNPARKISLSGCFYLRIWRRPYLSCGIASTSAMLQPSGRAFGCSAVVRWTALAGTIYSSAFIRRHRRNTAGRALPTNYY